MSLATAGKDFCAGTGYSSPEQAIAAGAKTILDWCEFLAKIPKNSPARPIEQSPIKIANTRSLESWYRKTILECIAKHCEQHPWGILTREIHTQTGYQSEKIREICTDLLEEGLLVQVRVLRRGVRSDAALYRIPDMEARNAKS
jgi:hypothetical protein